MPPLPVLPLGFVIGSVFKSPRMVGGWGMLVMGAIIWVSGGFNWGIDRGAWTPERRANDQSATTFLHAGIVLMRPSLRGRNGNPGQPECFVGEVDDIIAAGEYLLQRSPRWTRHCSREWTPAA